jgi:hypothetical protein
MRTFKVTVAALAVAMPLTVGVERSFAGVPTVAGVASVVATARERGSVDKVLWRGRWGWGWRRPGWGWGGPAYGWGGPGYWGGGYRRGGDHYTR